MFSRRTGRCYLVRSVERAKPFCSCDAREDHNTKFRMLSCTCGEEHGSFDWTWDDSIVTNDMKLCNEHEVRFHPSYSSGTAVVRGKIPFQKNLHYYWEIKMLTILYGTDVMVGVGTEKCEMKLWEYRFCSYLGHDKESWGYSYRGSIQHHSEFQDYGPTFNQGSIIGVHLDMCNGTLEYYHNRKPLGIAFHGLKNLELYPMVSSTAAQSAVKLTCAISASPTLQLLSLQTLIDNNLYKYAVNKVPGLKSLLTHNFWWLLPNDDEDTKELPPKVQIFRALEMTPDEEEADERDSSRKRKRHTYWGSLDSQPGAHYVVLNRSASDEVGASSSDSIFEPCENCGIIRACKPRNPNSARRLCIFCDVIF